MSQTTRCALGNQVLGSQAAPCSTGADAVCVGAQQDITRGRAQTDSLYQGGQAMGGTHNAILSSEDYLSQVLAVARGACLLCARQQAARAAAWLQGLL